MELGTCYLDCVFQIRAVMSADAKLLDTNKLMSILVGETPNEPDTVRVTSSALTQCITDMNNGALRFRSPTLYNCSTVPSAIMMCIHRKFFAACPAQRFANVPQCVTLRDYLARCPIII